MVVDSWVFIDSGIHRPAFATITNSRLEFRKPVIATDLVLPNPNHTEPTGLEPGIDEPIPRNVPLNLIPPKRGTALGQSSALWAAMPEATVDKQREFDMRKVEVRSTEDPLRVAPPAYDLRLSQNASNGDLCRLVAPSLDAGHYCRALFACQCIHNIRSTRALC